MTPAAMQALLEGNLKNFKIASTPGGIEAQDKEGQQELIKSELLPRYDNSGKNVFGKYIEFGIKFDESKGDDLFMKVKLPKGWKTVAREDHDMWSNLIDDKGNEIAEIFYKAAFYDRRSFIRFKEKEAINAFEAACKVYLNLLEKK